jgi:plasmid maintenance system antidote protein VapI
MGKRGITLEAATGLVDALGQVLRSWLRFDAARQYREAGEERSTTLKQISA